MTSNVTSAAPAQSPWPRRSMTCGRCGAAFDCGSGGRDGGCWCADVPLRMPLPSGTNEDCLCPACLRRTAALQTSGNSE
ncbi:MAG: cysteine-rich CWC family protein [Pseudolabrys sp.]|nr:cysteine-rich CWC family protein [Pseudolabrys sp.]